MGKYMNKSKIIGDVALMDLSQSTTLGVRTRAKTLALQRLQPSSPSASPNLDTSSFSYLQLRSRRLEKPALLNDSKKLQLLQEAKQNSNSTSTKKLNSKGTSRFSKSSVKVAADCDDGEGEGCFSNKGEMLGLKCEAEDLGFEGSFGDNYLDFEPRERSTRESTPCSLIRDSNTIGTPGSTTRQGSSTTTNRRVRNVIQRNNPTTKDMEEFFACAEQKQQRLFIEKYNFDVVNDLPLPGRYEWVQVIPK
ncbi:hypothetical protein P3X46_011871 [Hevea brasiliensis]|uniref:Cyclin-dependent kinase inhibitor domain-containing protein n=1 Tax=Hevea brasiliensis TaxID=3981 RepID=A0ABQ9M8G0_HEVBR|nr:cyclin-dependent kinase inhibitor 3 [Hevea brasiliensis]XP_058005853.1 cyclin-dependent kinase inhibitor 3-like [Hevea brasiliensis]KAJ9176572.1 hypothetical protein P3X46_011871 [Hevea brasiliensis]